MATSETIEVRYLYLTRNVPLDEFCFFLEPPEMHVLKNANILWLNAEHLCSVYAIQLIIPALNVPAGKCWLIRVEQMSDGSNVVKVMDGDVKVRRSIR